MRAKLKACCFLTATIFVNAFVPQADLRDGDYSIPVFRVGQQRINLARTDVIVSETGDSLREIDSLPKLRTGQVIYRHRIANRFAFFKGILDTAAFGKNPVLYTFKIPSWASLSDIVQYRFFRSPTEKNGNDEDEIYFDAEHIYIKHFPEIYYYKDFSWNKLEGSSSLPLGGIEIFTDPPGAQIVIDGKEIGLFTPYTFKQLLAGVYSFELVLPGYNTFQKSVRIYPGNMVTAAFELLSDMDTIYISGKAPYGLLILPQPPTDSLFYVDSNRIFSLKTRLHPGAHRLRWNGAEMYESIDTIITISEGIVAYFDHVFKRRYGVLRVIPSPSDAEVCIEGLPCKIGEQLLELPSDRYTISAFHLGFRNLKKPVTVFPDTITVARMDLTQMPDIDGDGFVDSVDECPDKYGLFGGCPRMKPGEALKAKREEIKNFLKTDPLTFGSSLIGGLNRVPTSKRFGKFLSSFSGVKIGGINNYRGMTMVNNYHIQYRGLFTGLELGQWIAGLSYQRDDTLEILTKEKKYLIFNDSINIIEPVMYIPSTALCFGLHYSWSWVNLVYAIGYQWEDIILDQIYNATDDRLERITMNNDWWFHQIGMEANFNFDGFVVPSVYARMKLPFGKSRVTRWLALQTGIQFKLVPSNWKNR